MMDTLINQSDTHIGDFERVCLWRHNVAKLTLNIKIGNRISFIFSLMMEPKPTFETLGCLFQNTFLRMSKICHLLMMLVLEFFV